SGAGPPRELVEYRAEHLGRHTWTLVSDGYEDPAGIAAHPGADDYRGRRRRVDRRVEEELRDHLLHEGGIRAEDRKVGRDLDRERMFADPAAQGPAGRGDQVMDIAPVQDGLEDPGLQPVLAQQVSREVVQPARGDLELGGQGGPLSGVGGAELLDGRAKDRYRRHQLVREGVEERLVQAL